MSGKKLSDLSNIPDITANDLFLTTDQESLTSYKITASNLAAYTTSAIVSTTNNLNTLFEAFKTIDGSGSGLDADLLDGQQGSYYQPASTALTTSTTFGGDVSGTYNAIVVANDSHNHTYLNESPNIEYGVGKLQWTDTSSADSGTGLDGSTPQNPSSTWYHHLIMNHHNSSGYYVDIAANFFEDELAFRRLQGGTLYDYQYLYHDGYHPYANALTTARTISLGGDVSGSASFDGSANVTITATVANDSHTHDSRYYTESEIDTKLTDGTVNKINDSTQNQAGNFHMYVNDGGGNIGMRWNSTTGSTNLLVENGIAYELEIANDSSTGTFGINKGSTTSGTAGETISWTNAFRVSGADNYLYAYGQKMWTAGNDGSGSGLDADLLDGQHGSYYTDYADSVVGSNSSTKVSKSGDTMTGNLSISKDNAAIVIGSGSYSGAHGIYFYDSNNSIGIQQLYRTNLETLNWEAKGGSDLMTLDKSGNLAVSGTVDGRDIAADGSKLDGIEAGATADQTASEILTAIKTVDGPGSGLNADLLDGQQGSYYTGYTDNAIASLVSSSPSTLDTLNELAAALGNDPNFATTITTSIATKVAKSGDTMTGDLAISKSGASLQLGTGSNSGPHGIYFYDLTGGVGIQQVYRTTPEVLFWELSNGSDLMSLDKAGDLTIAGTVNGRNISTDGSKLDGIEAGATADQTASEILTAIKTVDGPGSGLNADLLDGQQGSYYLDYTNFSNTPQAGLVYTRKTTTYTATAYEGIIADTSGGSWTLTLPSSPSAGDVVVIADGNNWGANNLTVARNGSTIEGDAEDMVMDIGGLHTTFLYDGTTWQIYAQAGIKDPPTTISFGNWSISEVSGNVIFSTGGVDKMKLDTSGNLTVIGDIITNGTI